MSPYDLVYYGDVDQLVRPECLWMLKWSKEISGHGNSLHIGLQMFVHSFYWRFHGDWQGTTVLTTVKFLEDHTSSFKIDINQPNNKLSNSGWHLTWFLQPSDWIRKMDGYSHFDWSKPEYKQLSWIEVNVTVIFDYSTVTKITTELLTPSTNLLL